MSNTIDINKDIVAWAITRNGVDVDDFILNYPQHEDWINEVKGPTLKELEKFSNDVRIPFGYLFLNSPPEETSPIPFFRAGEKVMNVSVDLYETLTTLQQRQDWLRNYLMETDYSALTYVGKYSVKPDIMTVAEDIRSSLGLAPDWASSFSTWETTLIAISGKVEEIGIVINFNSIVGNNTRRHIDVAECRGFVLVDDYAPFMFVNSSDAKAAQLFTIAHELAHIWVGKSAGFDFRKLMPANDPVEIVCDKIAAEFLVPASLFKSVWEADNSISGVARFFKVSELVIARRALDLNKISMTDFYMFYEEYLDRVKAKMKKKSSSGNFYATAKRRISKRFAIFVDQAVSNNRLLYRDAYRLTGLKGSTYKTFYSKLD